MKFAEPSWLIVGLLVIAGMIFIYRLLDARQRAALAEFASSHLLAKLTASFSPGRRMLKRGLFIAALACIFVALARPQWGYHWVDQKERGIDLLFAIDTSKSMLTQDVNPDRLTRAKMAITDFVRQLDGDRVGLIAFAGQAFLQAPLTLDYDAFQDTLDSIDVNTIPRGGTDIGSAIQEAQAAFANNAQNKKILILVTDGEDLQGQGVEAARAAAKDGMVIYTVGVGTAAGGLIPVPNGNGTDFMKDPATGEYVKSHLDENTLTQIAEATGGMYQPLGQQGQGLGVIYDKAIASMPKHDIASRRTRVYEERFQWPLAAGLGLLFASMLIGTRRRAAAPAKPAGPVRATKRAAALVLALLALPAAAHASVQSAENEYKKGNYSKAEAQYEDAAAQHPDDAPLQFDLGAAAYKTGEFDTALPAFQKALGSDDPALQQQSYYNIGNTQFRIGQKTVQSAPQQTIQQWQQAVQAYDSALKLKPDDGDAKYNRDYVEKKLEELEKQQKQQQKQDQKNQQDKNQQQNQQNQNQQQQNQNQQNQQNQQQQNQQGQGQQQNQDQQQQNQQQSGSKGSQGNQQDQQQQQNGQNQAQNGQQNQQGQQQQQSANNQGQDKNQSGQQQQQTAGNQQQDPNKNGQQQPQQTAGGQQQDQNKGGQQQQQQTAGNQPQNQQQPNGNGGDQQQAQNKAGDGGATAQAAAAAADKDKQSGDQSAEAVLPGAELTKEQAKDLLNSLKGEEHILPVAADTRAAHPDDQPVVKDW